MGHGRALTVTSGSGSTGAPHQRYHPYSITARSYGCGSGVVGGPGRTPPFWMVSSHETSYPDEFSRIWPLPGCERSMHGPTPSLTWIQQLPSSLERAVPVSAKGTGSFRAPFLLTISLPRSAAALCMMVVIRNSTGKHSSKFHFTRIGKRRAKCLW